MTDAPTPASTAHSRGWTLEEMRELYREARRELATPIDFDELVATGLLEACDEEGWYVPLDIHSLPRHAKMKIVEMKFTHPFGPHRIHFSEITEPPDL